MKKEKQQNQEEPKFDFRSIKSFEDACKKENISTDLPKLENGCQELLKPIIAAYKLMVIFKAINHDWTADWSNTTQKKWFPWFWVHPSGVSFSRSGTYYDYECTSVGSRLCCESDEKCQYIAETFTEEYKDFLLYR